MTTLPPNPWPLIEVVRRRVAEGRATADQVAAAQRAAVLASPATMLSVIDSSFTTPAHVKLIDQHLVALQRGEFDRLMIVAPPRHGKSRLGSEAGPLWRLRRDKSSQQAIVTYGSTLSTQFGGWSRDAITANPALDLKIRQSSKAKDRWQLAGSNGGLYAVGVGGALTGRGFHDGQLDDLVANAEEANSATTLDNQWDWFWSTFMTRRTRVAHRVTIGAVWTRWSEEDVGGRLLRDERERWCLLHMRAVAEQDETLASVTDADAAMLARWDGDEVGWDRKAGEALWPDVYGLDYLSEFMGQRYTWSALFQGSPTPTAGNLFRKEDFRYFSVEQTHEGSRWVLNHDRGVDQAARTEYVRPGDCTYFATADLAASVRTSADWTVIAVWALTPGGDLLLVDRYRGRIGEDRHFQEAQKLHARWKFTFMSVEKGFVGTRLVYDAGRAGLNVREYDPRTADKITRAMPAVDRYTAGRIWHPLPASAPWIATELEPELLGFGGGGAHDDFVDAVAQACHFVPNPRGRRKTSSRFAADDKSQEARFARLQESSGHRSKRKVHPELGRL